MDPSLSMLLFDSAFIDIAICKRSNMKPRRICVYCGDRLNQSVHIPTSYFRRKKWLDILGLNDDKIPARVYLCPTHFKQEDITDVLEWSVIVKPQALPIPLIDWNSLHPAAVDYLRGQKYPASKYILETVLPKMLSELEPKPIKKISVITRQEFEDQLTKAPKQYAQSNIPAILRHKKVSSNEVQRASILPNLKLSGRNVTLKLNGIEKLREAHVHERQNGVMPTIIRQKKIYNEAGPKFKNIKITKVRLPTNFDEPQTSTTKNLYNSNSTKLFEVKNEIKEERDCTEEEDSIIKLEPQEIEEKISWISQEEKSLGQNTTIISIKQELEETFCYQSRQIKEEFCDHF